MPGANSNLGPSQDFPTIPEWTAFSGQGLVNGGIGQVIEIASQYCRFVQSPEHIPEDVRSAFPCLARDMIQVGIREIEPEIPLRFPEKTVGDHAGKSAVPTFAAMDSGSFGEPDFIPATRNNGFGPVKDRGVLAGWINVPMPDKWFVSGKVRGQIFQLGNGDFLTSHQIGKIGPENLEYQFFAKLPVVGTVQGVEEADIKGHEAHAVLES